VRGNSHDPEETNVMEGGRGCSVPGRPYRIGLLVELVLAIYTNGLADDKVPESSKG
jgi:hypothetical protein